MSKRDPNRLSWYDFVQKVVQLLASAAGPIAQLIDAIAKLH